MSCLLCASRVPGSTTAPRDRKRWARHARSPHVTDLLYSCPQPEKKSKKGKEKSKKQKEQQKEKEQTKKKKKEGKEKKMRGQAPKKKKEEPADEGDEGEVEEDEEDPEIVLLGKKQGGVASAKVEVARMTAAGTGMGR